METGKLRRTWRGPVTGAWGGRDRDGAAAAHVLLLPGDKDAREDADMGGDIDPRGVSGTLAPCLSLCVIITDHCPQAFPASP